MFGYGSFSEEDVRLTAQALKYFGYGVPGFALIKVLSNFFFARDNTKLPFYISLFSVVLNVLISLTFFKSFGFLIIPLATSIATWAGVIVYLMLLLKYNYFEFKTFLVINFIKIIVSALIMVLFLHFGINFFEDNLIYDNYYKVFYLIIVVTIAAIIFLITSNLLGVLKIKNFKTN